MINPPKRDIATMSVAAMMIVSVLLIIAAVGLRMELNDAQAIIAEYEQAGPVVVYHNEPFTQLLITDSGPFAVKMQCAVIDHDQQVPSRADIPEGSFLVTEGSDQSEVVARYLCERSL